MADLADRPFVNLVDVVITPLCARFGPGARVVVLGARDAAEEAFYAGRLARAGYVLVRLSPADLATVAMARRSALSRRPQDARSAARALLASLGPERAEGVVVVCPFLSAALGTAGDDPRIVDAAGALARVHAAWSMAPI